MKTLSYIVLLLYYQRFRRMFNEVIKCNKNKKNQFKKRKHKTLDPTVFMNGVTRGDNNIATNLVYF